MLALHKPPKIFIQLAYIISALHLSAALFGFKPFYSGLWNVEPIMMAVYVFSTLSAAWIVWGLARGWVSFQWRAHTLSWLWVAWLGWQLIATLCADSPWRSWFGPPEQSEGLSWYVCISVMMLHWSALWNQQRFRRFMLGYAAGFMLLLSLSCFITDVRHPLLPFPWSQYLVFMLGWVWIAYAASGGKFTFKHSLIFVLGLIWVCYASSNKSGSVLLTYAALISCVASYSRTYGLRHFRTVSNTWRVLCALALLLPLSWFVLSQFPAHLPSSFTANKDDSMPTRVIFNQISLNLLEHEPLRMLRGNGWGRYVDDSFRYGLVDDIHIYENGQFSPNWMLILGYNYHSHNMATETVLSLGLIGLLLWLLLPMVAIRTLPADRFWYTAPMVTAMTVLGYVWFPVPQCAPYQALCWLALLSACTAQEKSITLSSQKMGALMALVCVMLAWSAYQQREAMHYSNYVKQAYRQPNLLPLSTEYLLEDAKRGGDRFRISLINYGIELTRNQELAGDAHIQLYDNFLLAARTLAASPSIGARNSTLDLYGYNVLLTRLVDPKFNALLYSIGQYYPGSILHATRVAPLREDIVAPYFITQYDIKTDPDHSRLMPLISEILGITPVHRTALWLGGSSLIAKKEFRDAGREMMQAALDLHAERVYPISNKEIENFKKK